jgi:uncharacterized protein YegJ (DUF2314 family)
MTKPIPVFTFVFAAYAATVAAHGSASRPALIKSLQKNDPFLDAWRAKSARGGVLWAKVGLLSGVREGALRLATINSTEVFEEFWLDDIAWTRLGFIGAAVDDPELPLLIKPGQRMRFHRINVLDWRLEDRRTARSAPKCARVSVTPRDMLAELSKTVGS